MSSVYLDQADKQQFQTQALTRVTVQSVSLARDSTSQLLPLIGQLFLYHETELHWHPNPISRQELKNKTRGKSCTAD